MTDCLLTLAKAIREPLGREPTFYIVPPSTVAFPP